MSKCPKDFSIYLEKSSKCHEISRVFVLTIIFPQWELKSISEIVYTVTMKWRGKTENSQKSYKFFEIPQNFSISLKPLNI